MTIFGAANKYIRKTLWKQTLPFLAIVICLVSPAAAEENKLIVAQSDLQINSHRSDAFWIDNQTLIFSGARGVRPGSESDPINFVEFPDKRAHIFLWKMGRAPIAYKEGIWPAPSSMSFENYLCGSDGKVTYSLEKISRSKGGWSVPVAEGPIGKEHQEFLQYHRNDSAWTKLDLINPVGKRCAQIHVPLLEGHYWALSHSGEWVLDFGTRLEPSPWQYQPKQDKPTDPYSLVELSDQSVRSLTGVDRRWVEPSCSQSPEWEDAIIVWLCPVGSEFSKAKVLPIWKVHRDGSSEEVDVEKGGLEDPTLVAFKDAYVLVGDGIYVVRAGKPKLALAGYYFRALAVSPNGCLGAFAEAIAFQFGQSREQLIVLDMCKAEKE